MTSPDENAHRAVPPKRDKQAIERVLRYLLNLPPGERRAQVQRMKEARADRLEREKAALFQKSTSSTSAEWKKAPAGLIRGAGDLDSIRPFTGA